MAGAGTGKTRVLTRRFVHLAETVDAERIMAVTFTTKASDEMKRRIQRLLGGQRSLDWIGTFHSLSAKILRTDGPLVGVPQDFHVLDSSAQLKKIQALFEERRIAPSVYPAAVFVEHVEGCKNRGLVPDLLSTGDLSFISDTKHLGLFPQTYRAYEALLDQRHACDFGRLMLKTVELFQAHPEVLRRYQTHFEHILVDECQDTNLVQHQWLMALAQNNLYCVGDENQRIYGWRGAVSFLPVFQARYPHATVVHMTENYRSTGHILDAASGLISHNVNPSLPLKSTLAMGAPVEMQGFVDEEAEADHIAKTVGKLRKEGMALSNIAVLVRSGFQIPPLQEAFERFGLSEPVPNPAVEAYVALVKNPQDDAAFEASLTNPKRGFGHVFLEHLREKSAGRSLFETAEAECLSLKGAKQTVLKTFLDQIKRWRAFDGEDLVKTICETFEFSPTGPAGPSVPIMTIHAVKGLEFEAVFLAGWEENVLPSRKSLMTPEGLAEERRLAYVGLTRAKQRVWISWAKSRMRAGTRVSSRSSRFISDLPKSHIHREGAASSLEQTRVKHALFGEGDIVGRHGDVFDVVFSAAVGKKKIGRAFLTVV